MIKVLIVDSDLDGRSSLAIQSLKEKFGDDIILVTPQQAIEQEIPLDEFVNIPIMKLTAPPVFEVAKLYGSEMTGQEKRRERRRKERKDKNR